MKKWIAGLLALIAISPVMAATPWQQITHPVAGSPQAIGGFANGCVIGAMPLPLESADYQVMRPDQRRYFGHPDLLNFIHRLSDKAQKNQLGTVLIGDMAMPAGGRFSSGHASHQSGLDVDIWLQLPKQRWSQQQLLKPQPIDLVAADGKRVVPALWQPQVENLIKLAANDNEVTRIFVNPAIKKQLCLDAGADRTGCIRCGRGLGIAPICMCVCVAQPIARNVWTKIRHHRVMGVVLNWKVGSSLINQVLNRAKPYHHHCHLPVRLCWITISLRNKSWIGLPRVLRF